MKKKLVGLIIGTMGLMLVACGSQEKEDDISVADVKEAEVIDLGTKDAEDVETDEAEDEIYEGFGMSNPWVDSDKAGVLEATGFELVAPEEAANVAYSYMASTGMAQMNFTMDNAMWVYRIQPTDGLEDISGIYCEWNYTGEAEVAGMEAMEYNYASEQDGDYLDDMECTRVINWYDEQKKLTYSLSVMGADLNGMDTFVYAEALYNLGSND